MPYFWGILDIWDVGAAFADNENGNEHYEK
jgi:hypothetical protein